MTPARLCSHCGLLKTLECFWARQSRCKPCHKRLGTESKRRLRAANPERFREIDRRGWEARRDRRRVDAAFLASERAKWREHKARMRGDAEWLERHRALDAAWRRRQRARVA